MLLLAGCVPQGVTRSVPVAAQDPLPLVRVIQDRRDGSIQDQSPTLTSLGRGNLLTGTWCLTSGSALHAECYACHPATLDDSAEKGRCP